MAKTNYTPRERNAESAAALAAAELNGVVPPQAVELEEAVLGALMLEGDRITSVQDYLTPETFYDPRHRTIYQAIYELSSENLPIDLYTVTERLKKLKKLKEVGGAAFLAQLTQKVGSAMNLDFHAKIIAQKHIQRRLIDVSTRIQENAYDDSKDVTETLEFAESEIFKISEGSIKREVQSSRNLLDKALKTIEEAAARGGRMSGVPTGFTRIDELTQGWQPSDLIIVAARPSMGKTAFVLSMARNITIDHERPVAFFSLEMSATQLMIRLIVSESGLSSRDIRSGQLTQEQWRHLEESTKPLATAPLFIDDTPALSISEFRSKARRLKSQHDIQLIIIDYLQLMTCKMDSKAGSREQEVSTISRSLKSIAKELDIPIIALSQLNRSVESRTGSKRPQLSDLRESGAIEQDADIVAFIHRPEYYKLFQDDSGNSTVGMAEIIVAKHRNGATDVIKLRFRNEQARFLDYDDMVYSTIESSMNDDADGFGSSSFGTEGVSDFDIITPGAKNFGAPLGTSESEEDAPF